VSQIATTPVDQILETLRAAAAANLQSPPRRGNIIDLTAEEAEDVMITADLHGHRSNFDRLLEIADLDRHPKRHMVMQEVCHGGPTYNSPTCGCMSHQMLEDVARLKVQYGPRFHFLLSNHELAELTDYPIIKHGKILPVSFRIGVSQCYGDRAEEVRKGHLDFIANCPLGVRLANGVFISHSAPECMDTKGFDLTVLERGWGQDDLRPGGSVFRMLWGRDYRPENAEAFAAAIGAQILIHGHTPCAAGYSAPNRRQIILDCCGEPAGFVILPVAESLTVDDVLDRVRVLE